MIAYIQRFSNKMSFKRFNLFMTFAWTLMLPIAYLTDWIYSVAFISLASIYANAASHLGAWRADDNPQIDNIEKKLEEE